GNGIRRVEHHLLVRRYETWRIDLHLVFHWDLPACERAAHSRKRDLRTYPSAGSAGGSVSPACQHLVGRCSHGSWGRLLDLLCAGKGARLKRFGKGELCHGKQEKNDDGLDCWEPRIFPGPPGEIGPGRNDSGFAQSGNGRGRPHPGREQTR